jgi:hypothetical protein
VKEYGRRGWDAVSRNREEDGRKLCGNSGISVAGKSRGEGVGLAAVWNRNLRRWRLRQGRRSLLVEVA